MEPLVKTALLLFACLMCIHTAYSRNLNCPAGMVWTECSSSCRLTCWNYDEPTPCTADCGRPRCQCPADAPIFHRGRCITADECPNDEVDENGCSGGQVFSTCASACTVTCDNIDEPTICTQQCEAGCVCPPERPVRHHGHCVPERACRFINGDGGHRPGGGWRRRHGGRRQGGRGDGEDEGGDDDSW